jgi:hypothetical protein
MKFLTKNSNIWKTVDRLFVKISDVWKPAKAIWFKNAGNWVKIYSSGFSVTAAIPTIGWNVWANGPRPRGQSANGDAWPTAQAPVTYRGVTVQGLDYRISESNDHQVLWWTYFIFFNTAPVWTGDIKVTNVTTGISVVMQKANATEWTTIFNNNSVPYDPDPDNPRDLWIRNIPAVDVFKIEDA